MVVNELEALSMTLNERELMMIGESGEKDSELQLSRRPSQQEWKDVKI